MICYHFVKFNGSIRSLFPVLGDFYSFVRNPKLNSYEKFNNVIDSCSFSGINSLWGWPVREQSE
jgi:hypothetical protein